MSPDFFTSSFGEAGGSSIPGLGGSSFQGFSSFPSSRMGRRSSSFEDIPSMVTRRKKNQDPPIEKNINVSFEELLTGTQKKLKIMRKILNADGQTTRNEEKILTIDVKKGWKAGTKITFKQEGDQSPNRIPADIIFIIQDKPHPHFRRDADNNILYTAKISLRKALTGYFNGGSVPVPTLDNRTINIPLNDIVKPGTRKRIKSEGLPVAKRSGQRADLMVTFEVVFPTSLTKESVDAIERALPP